MHSHAHTHTHTRTHVYIYIYRLHKDILILCVASNLYLVWKSFGSVAFSSVSLSRCSGKCNCSVLATNCSICLPFYSPLSPTHSPKLSVCLCVSVSVCLGFPFKLPADYHINILCVSTLALPPSPLPLPLPLTLSHSLFPCLGLSPSLYAPAMLITLLNVILMTSMLFELSH